MSSPSSQPSQTLYSLLQELLQPLSPLLDELICAAHEEGGFPGQLWDRPAGTEQRQRLRVRSEQGDTGAPWQQQPGPCFVQNRIPGAQVSCVSVWGFYPHLFREDLGSPGQWETVFGCGRGKGGSTRHAYTKPAFFWSCLLSHTNSRYRRRTHEVLAVKALLLVCKKKKKKKPPRK